MNKNRLHITNRPCPSIDQLIAYREGKLLPEESYAIESHLVDCAICFDLIEGLENMANTDQLSNIEAELKVRLEQMLEKKEKRNIPLYIKRLAIAASILLFIGITYIVYLFNTKPTTQLAQEVEIEVPDKIIVEKKDIETTTEYRKIQTIKNTGIHNEKETVAIEYSESLAAAEMVVESSDMAVFGTDAQIVDIESKNKPAVSKPEPESLSKDENIHTYFGKIIDESGNPLPGANIRISGTKKGTVSDTEGRFAISTEKENKTLQVDYLGYISKTDSLNKDTLTIAMNPDVSSLDEVVVIGYGVQKKSELTGAIASIGRKKKKIQVSEALQGKTAGVAIEKEVRIRGTKNDNAFYNAWQLKKNKIIDLLKQKNKDDAVKSLDSLKSNTNDNIKINKIIDIIELVNKEKYKKALKKLEEL